MQTLTCPGRPTLPPEPPPDALSGNVQHFMAVHHTVEVLQSAQNMVLLSENHGFLKQGIVHRRQNRYS